jgi:hypothetical protein
MPDDASPRRLLDTVEACATLSCEPQDPGWLVRTGQLTQLWVCGEAVFASDDVQRLIDVYKRVQGRRKP